MPSSWGNGAFSALSFLYLVSNALTGPLLDAWSKADAFPELFGLELDYNRLTGTLPEDWAATGVFSRLHVLSVAYNNISGSIPDSWGSSAVFPSLQALGLGGTKLQGGLPAFDDINLQFLYLARNSLNGSLDAFWSSSAPLQLVELSENSLSGSLPEVGSALSQLTFLNLNLNQLQGSLPLTWLQADSLMSHVTVLNVDNLWKASVRSSVWRKQLCLQSKLYDADVTGASQALLLQQQGHLQSVQGSLPKNATEYRLNPNDGYGLSMQTYFVLAALDYNQLASVSAICANSGAHNILLIAWLVFGVCCALAIALYILAGYCFTTTHTNKHAVRLRTRLLPWLFPLYKVASVLREAFWGLAMLAFYYYDLVSNIVVLKHVRGKWPGDILAAVFLFHFAFVGAVVAYQGLRHRAIAKHASISRNFDIVTALLAVVASPFMIPTILFLDTLSFVRQVFLCAMHIVQWPTLKWLCPVYMSMFGLYQCVRADNPLGLNWLDLEEYEGTHNLIAALFQSLPTAVLNSILLALGNKPSHGEFLSNQLFIVAFVASALAMWRSLAMILWKAYSTTEPASQSACSVALGGMLAPDQVKTTHGNSSVACLVDRYQSSGLQTLGAPGTGTA